jgi:hypothetical protein
MIALHGESNVCSCHMMYICLIFLESASLQVSNITHIARGHCNLLHIWRKLDLIEYTVQFERSAYFSSLTLVAP